MKKLLFLFLIVATARTVHARCDAAKPHEGVCTALNASYTEVKKQYDIAEDGDTVLVPGGTPGDWSNGPLVMTKGVHIKGAGPNSTFLQGTNALGVYANCFFQIDGGTGISSSTWTGTSPSGKPYHPRISNLTMQFAGASRPSNGFINFAGHVMEYQIDHCDFKTDTPGASVGIVRSESSFWGWGVFHHNHFANTISSDSIQTDQPGWLPVNDLGVPTVAASAIPIRNKGDGSWADGPHWAKGLGFRFEDNIFENYDFSLVTLSNGGARREARYNTFINSQVGGHGAETNHPGGRTTEYYNNRYWRSAFQAQGPFNSRTSSSICFNNRATNVATIDRVTAYRRAFIGECWGSASGANTWDKNKKGNFRDVWGNDYRTDVLEPNGSFVDSVEGHGDVYWHGQYPIGSTRLENNGQTVVTLTGQHLDKNGLNGPSPKRWVGFTFRNKTMEERVIAGASTQPFLETGVQIVSATADSVTIMGSGQATAPGAKRMVMEIRPGDFLEIRMVDTYIHQSGQGKGDVLESVANLARDDTIVLCSPLGTNICNDVGRQTVPADPKPPLLTSWNFTKLKRIFPNDAPNGVVDGMWFWNNRCASSTADLDFKSADIMYYDDTKTQPTPNVNVSDNPQQFLLGRDVFLPGTDPAINNPLVLPNDPSGAGRPAGYPYNGTLPAGDTRRRVGADNEAYATFAYYNNNTGIHCGTLANGQPRDCSIQPGAAEQATESWGRAYPDYLIDTGPRFTSAATASFSNDSASETPFPITTTGFVGATDLTISAWKLNGAGSDVTLSTVTFTNNASRNGTATLSGTASGITAGTYKATITATSATQTQTQSFSLTITGTNQNPTIDSMTAVAHVGTTLVAPAQIDLDATASDPEDGNVKTMRFSDLFNGTTTVLGPADILGSPASLDLTGVVAGTHNYTVTATDKNSGSTTSSAVVVVVASAPGTATPTPTPAKIILKP